MFMQATGTIQEYSKMVGSINYIGGLWEVGTNVTTWLHNTIMAVHAMCHLCFHECPSVGSQCAHTKVVHSNPNFQHANIQRTNANTQIDDKTSSKSATKRIPFTSFSRTYTCVLHNLNCTTRFVS